MKIHLLAEGDMEEDVGRRLLAVCGHAVGDVYGRHGCGYVRKKAKEFKYLANDQTGLLILTDFRDSKAICVAAALRDYLGELIDRRPRSFLCRFAVPELESWLMADHYGLAKFLGVPLSRIPQNPEDEPHPKSSLIGIARHSRKTSLRVSLVPPSGHGGAFAPGYASVMRGFISRHWNPEAASERSPSLLGCLKRLRELPQGSANPI